jgi:hypothetical protein
MSDRFFKSADILLPNVEHMEKWSVIACDQFSSQPEYWEETERIIGDAPSTLRMMLPEAWLVAGKTNEEPVESVMERYLNEGIFRTVEDSYIYVERELSGGSYRRGLIGVIDLEAYDYAPDSKAPIRASEGTVAERLGARIELRRVASLEMPHVMVFVHDSFDAIISTARQCRAEKLYDFELMQGGGHIAGWRVGDNARVESAIDELCADAGDNVVFAIGDGNHSLAAAKLCWEEMRESLSPEERENHPARFCLVELVNIYDESIEFEPINRILFDTKSEGFVEEARECFSAQSGDMEYDIKLLRDGKTETVVVHISDIASLISLAEDFARRWQDAYGGRLDYVHWNADAVKNCRRQGCCGILLPAMYKEELFEGITANGSFPRKSFSMGEAWDKRYYLECRKIKKSLE